MIQKAELPAQEVLKQAAEMAGKVLPQDLKWALVPSTGTAELIGRLDEKARLDGSEIAPGWLHTTILWGRHQGHPLLLVDPPPAPWEQESPGRTLFLYRFFAALGIEKVVITTACASLDPSSFGAGSVGLVRDHLDFSGLNPLRRCRPEEAGAPFFPDLTRAYDPDLRRRLLATHPATPQPLLAAVPGPSLPTPAEYTFYRNSGAEAAAMRGPQEVIAAVQAGLKVALAAAATQEIDLPDPAPADLEQMVAAADEAAPRLVDLALALIEEV